MIKRLKKFLFKTPMTIHVVSYPKSGRTWLTVMVGEYIKRKHNIAISDLMKIHEYSKDLKGIPNIKFSHDDRPIWKTPEQLERNKARYKRHKVLLLVRDPKDVIVSAYFERTKRLQKRRHDIPVFEGTMSEYARQEVGGINTIIEFYNLWLLNKDVPKDFTVVRYEDMSKDTVNVLVKVLSFIGFKNIDLDIINQIVEFAKFENMQKLEKQNYFESVFLKPGDVNDGESFKVRKGKIGGYTEYLSPEDISYLDNRISSTLDPSFNYGPK